MELFYEGKLCYNAPCAAKFHNFIFNNSNINVNHDTGASKENRE
jgi:hypothetical protein